MASKPEDAPVIEFCECSNYRGWLQAKEENGQFFWRVVCNLAVEAEDWLEIPGHLYEALKKYHDDTAERRKPQDDQDDAELV